jgi:hypothetical protein
VTLHNRNRFERGFLPLLAALVLFAAVCCPAQQSYIGRYDAFVGFSDINAPFVNNLNQPGVNIQGAIVNNRWISSGFDYSIQKGTGPLTASLLPLTLQQELKAELPPGYNLRIPTDATIQTFAAGSQLTYRHYAKTTVFIHPVLCAFRVTATPHPTDPISTAVVAALIPSGTKRDWTGGYGIGGGAELYLSKHLSAHMETDAVWSHPINDILANGGWIYRFSVGPVFHFGRNIEARKKK